MPLLPFEFPLAYNSKNDEPRIEPPRAASELPRFLLIAVCGVTRLSF